MPFLNANNLMSSGESVWHTRETGDDVAESLIWCRSMSKRVARCIDGRVSIGFDEDGG